MAPGGVKIHRRARPAGTSHNSTDQSVIGFHELHAKFAGRYLTISVLLSGENSTSGNDGPSFEQLIASTNRPVEASCNLMSRIAIDDLFPVNQYGLMPTERNTGPKMATIANDPVNSRRADGNASILPSGEIVAS